MEKNITLNNQTLVQPEDPTFGYFEDEYHKRFSIGIFLASIGLSAAWAIRKTFKFLKTQRNTTINLMILLEVVLFSYGEKIFTVGRNLGQKKLYLTNPHFCSGALYFLFLSLLFIGPKKMFVISESYLGFMKGGICAFFMDLNICRLTWIYLCENYSGKTSINSFS